MKKIAIIINILSFCFIFNSCEIDNYDAPNAKIFGGIYDYETHELIEQDVIAGSLIEYTELGWENSLEQYMIFKPDGTYRNNHMFAGDYSIKPTSGNFVEPEVKDITVKGEANVDFFVQPYIRVKEYSIEKSGNQIIASFKLEQTFEGTIASIALFSSKEPSVGNGFNQLSSVVPIFAPVDTTYIYSVAINIEGSGSILEPGQSYYFRVGAVANIPGAKYNYAPAISIVI